MLAVIALTVLAVAAVAGLVFLTLRSRLMPGPPLLSRTVVIHTRDGKSIRGVLFGQYADRVSLREASLLHGDGEQALGGLAHVPVTSIDWLQEIPPAIQQGE